MSEMLGIDFMQRALLAAFLVGLAAPLVGVFLVQRRLALIGDGMGHVALAGVAKYPARVKCALLSWSAFTDALYQAEGAKQ